MNVAKVMILIVAVGAIAAGLTTLVLTHLTVVDRWIIPYNFTVAQEGIGIVTDQTIPLPMGEAMAGSTLERFIYLGNPRSFPVVGIVSAQGPTASWVELGQRYRVAPGQTERVSLKVLIPDGAPRGGYQGTFLLSVYRDW